MDKLLSRITIDPAVCHGKPCVRGLRYPVEMLLELLSSGMTIDEILADYEDLERDDLLAALAFAAWLVGGDCSSRVSDSGNTVMTQAPEGFSYIPGFLTPQEQRTLLRQLKDLDYAHDTFRGQRLKRSYAQFGYAYVSTGRRLDPAAPLPDFLAALIDKAKSHFPEGARFNQCIVTHYPEGAGIGWHTDAPRFGECVMAVSLGSEAVLQFRPNGSEEVVYEIGAAPGSLYVMHGPARWDHQHQVVQVETERYSLTFRHVAESEGDRI
jgi:DNA oxidative demethylase